MFLNGNSSVARLTWQLNEVNDILAAALKARLKNHVALLPSLGHDKSERLAFVELDGIESAYQARKCGGRLAKALIADGADSCQLPAPPEQLSTEHYDAFLLGLSQGGYVDNRYRSKNQPELAKLLGGNLSKSRREQLNTRAMSIAWARDRINEPAEDLGPAEFVQAAKSFLRGSGCKIRVIGEEGLEKLGAGCHLAVGRASPRRPRILVVDWPGQGKASQKRNFLALVGKGVTFDTGGLQIKPGSAMSLMRKDMGGAATVTAAMKIIAQSNCSHPVRAYVPLADNAVDGSAFRPGDVLKAIDGTTVEIRHTDAEGRLLLADAMCLARKEGAKRLVTVATLTGAALVALGRLHVPVMGDEELINNLLNAAQTIGELGWQLPLTSEHQAMVRGSVADLTNSTEMPDAGTITAGAFLKHFADGKEFGHCDISPASWMTSAHDLGPAGATGVWVDTLARFARY